MFCSARRLLVGMNWVRCVDWAVGLGFGADFGFGSLRKTGECMELLLHVCNARGSYCIGVNYWGRKQYLKRSAGRPNGNSYQSRGEI